MATLSPPADAAGASGTSAQLRRLEAFAFDAAARQPAQPEARTDVAAPPPAARSELADRISTMKSPAFRSFLRQRRAEDSALLTQGQRLAEWRGLSSEERAAFECGEPGACDRGSCTPDRSAARPSAADFLRLQQKKQLLAVARPRSPTPWQQPKKKRKDAIPQVLLPTPTFQRRAVEPPAGRDMRRKELAQTLRVQASAKGSAVSVATSHSVDLAEVQARATAPTLSFDWPVAAAEDEEANTCDSAQLEVDLPSEAENSGAGMRGILREQLTRNVSAVRVTALLAKASG